MGSDITARIRVPEGDKWMVEYSLIPVDFDDAG